MTPILLAGPAVEPVSLADAKTWLRIEGNAEDELISGLVTAGRLMLEAATRTLFVVQSWRIACDAWPEDGLLNIPIAPFRSLDAFRTFDAANVPTNVPASAYELDSAPNAARIRLLAPLPAPVRCLSGIALDVTVGFGPLATDVPEPLRQAIRMMVARLYENRGDIESDPMPAAIASLIAPYRRARLA